MYRTIDEFVKETVSMKLGRRAGVVAAHDSHIMEAVVASKKDGVIKPTLIGKADEIKKILAELKEPEADYTIIDTPDDDASVAKAIELVKAGELDMLIKGIIETGQLMKQMVKAVLASAPVWFRFAAYSSSANIINCWRCPTWVSICSPMLNKKPQLSKTRLVCCAKSVLKIRKSQFCLP